MVRPFMNAEDRPSAGEIAEARAHDTRRGILDAAERLFAERGYSAASMREIARGAKTSQALLHHHFGTKAKLYEAVKQRFTERFDMAARMPSTANEPSPAFIVQIVRSYFSFLSQNPNLSRLASWARLEGDEAPWGASDAIWQHSGEWVQKAKSAGLIRSDVDDRFLLVVGAALVQYWVDNRSVLCRTLGIDASDATLDERYLFQALTILIQGIGAKAIGNVDVTGGQ
jgi:TetR/AcrR family transcriptional regulator